MSDITIKLAKPEFEPWGLFTTSEEEKQIPFVWLTAADPEITLERELLTDINLRQIADSCFDGIVEVKGIRELDDIQASRAKRKQIFFQQAMLSAAEELTDQKWSELSKHSTPAAKILAGLEPNSFIDQKASAVKANIARLVKECGLECASFLELCLHLEKETKNRQVVISALRTAFERLSTGISRIKNVPKQALSDLYEKTIFDE